MAILADLTQKSLRPQHTGVSFEPVHGAILRQRRVRTPGFDAPRFGYITSGKGYDQVVSDHVNAICAGESKASKAHKPFSDREPAPAPRKRTRRIRVKRLYKPVDGNQSGPLFAIYDRATGVALAHCRGVIHHVMREAEKLAKSQGGDLSDVLVELAS